MRTDPAPKEMPTGDSNPAVSHTATTQRVPRQADTRSPRLAPASREAGQGEMPAAFNKVIQAGRFVVKAGTAEESGHASNQAKFTPKGVTWIAGKWAKHQLSGQEEA